MILEQLKVKEKTDLQTYTREEPRFEDGEWWYIRPNGKRERVESHARKNTTRMFVNGKFIPKSHPLHKPGSYKALDDYSVVARMSTDNRHSMEKEMHRTFQHFSTERRGEWFKIDKLTAIKLFNYKIQENEVEA